MLTGKKIRLTAVKEQDLDKIADWFQNTDFLRLFDAVAAVPKTVQAFKNWLENDGDNEFRFAIRPLDNEEIIGFIEIDGILWNQRNAWISIAIGEAGIWNHGYGKEAMTLALNFCYGELNLHRVQLTVFEYNKRAIALYENLGFQMEGRYREFLKRDGKTYDMILFGMLENEWQQKKPE
jgi:RimJ/RimL family protein N-acetyltransferase